MQNSGTLTVRVAVDNGGTPTVRSATIAVKEPDADPWVARRPDRDEKPVAGQFFPRGENGVGTLHYNGTLKDAADGVFLKLYADGKLIDTATAKPAADKSYALSHASGPASSSTRPSSAPGPATSRRCSTRWTTWCAGTCT